MGFLRRLFGGGERDSAGASEPPDDDGPVNDEAVEAEERALTVALLREEQERLDEFRLRQLRYARFAWRPPAQGGERRADDADAKRESGREPSDD